MITMYDLTAEYAGLVAALEEAETDDDAMDIVMQIDAVTDDIMAKAENYAKIIANMKANAEGLEAQSQIIKLEAARIARKAEALNNRIEALKKRLLFAMDVTGMQRIPTSIGKFYTQKTTSVNVLDAWSVPAEFAVEQPPKIDKNAIKKAYSETGELFDGVEITVSNGLRFR